MNTQTMRLRAGAVATRPGNLGGLSPHHRPALPAPDSVDVPWEDPHGRVLLTRCLPPRKAQDDASHPPSPGPAEEGPGAGACSLHRPPPGCRGRQRARRPGVNGLFHTWCLGKKDLSFLERICVVHGEGAVPGRLPQEDTCPVFDRLWAAVLKVR